MRQLAQRAETSWPDFATLECSECHHDLRVDSWRIVRGYAGRRPGAVQVNPSLTEVVRVLVAQAAPEHRASLEASLEKVATLVDEHFSDGKAIAQAARALAQQADALTSQMQQTNFTPDTSRALIKALAVDISRIAGQGVYGAEQATMSLDSLSAAVTHNDPKAQQAMGELYKYLEHPSAYNGREFANLFRKAAGRFE